MGDIWPEDFEEKMNAAVSKQTAEITRLRAKNERLRNALMLCRTELRTAAGIAATRADRWITRLSILRCGKLTPRSKEKANE